MKKHSPLVLLLIGLFLQLPKAIAGFDLEVSIATSNPNPAIYSNVPVTVNASNAGDLAGKDVKIRIGVCGLDAFSFVQQTQLVFTATGTANSGVWDYLNQQWTIPNLAPGQTATLNFTLFTLTSDPRSIQVFTQTATTADMDSSPGNLPVENGLWTCTNNEDDEAVLTLNSGSTPGCQITASVSNLVCSDNGTPSDGTDDQFSFTLHAANPAPNTGYQVFIAQTSQVFQGTYGSPLTIQQIPISVGNLGLSLTDNLTANCSANLTVAAPAPCSNSGGGSGIDLELSLVQNAANPVVYSNYTTTALLVNKGNQPATGIVVKWEKPSGVVYTGGNEWTASQGSFVPFGNEYWTVGTIPANGSASLTVSYFLLQNGAPVTYAQVISANEADLDSQPGNGTPPIPNQDDEAATGGSAPPVLTPDLTISNLVVNGPGTPGQVLTYNFDLANTGNGPANGDFVVRAYISTSPVFTYTGIQDGVVPTGNFNAGFSVAEVPGASMLPSSLTTGLFYLHLFLDADHQVTETNENNNVVSASFFVEATPLPGACDDLVGVGTLHCLSLPANDNLEINYLSNNSYRKATLDGTGQVIADQAGMAPPSFPTFKIVNGNMEKTVGTVVEYSLPVPAVWSSEFDYFLNFSELGSGYVVFAYKSATQTLLALRTDANLMVLQTAALLTYGTPYPPYIETTKQLTTNEIAFTLRGGPGGTYGTVTNLLVINSNLDLVSNEVVQAAALSGTASLGQNACGQYTLNSAFTNYAHRGSWYGNTYRDGHFENGQFVVEYQFDVSEQSTMGYGNRYYAWETKQPDGTLILASYTQQLPIGTYPVTNIVHLEKRQGGTLIWEKDVKVSSAASIRRLAWSGDEVVFISEKNNAVFVEALNCVDAQNPLADLVVFNGGAYPGTVAVGSEVTVACAIFNTGLSNAAGFVATYVLSTDNQYSANDLLLGTIGPLEANAGQSVSQLQYFLVPNNLASGNYHILVVADPNNTIPESNENNNGFSIPITITGGTTGLPDCNAITITPGAGQITIAGATAPHVLIKVFRSNWTVAFECLDNCDNPLIISGLNGGTYFVQIKLLNSGWGEICFLQQTLSLNNFVIGAKDNRHRIWIDRIYPNPSTHRAFVEVYSPKAQRITLNVYDQQGRIVHAQATSLEEGANAIELWVNEWKSGNYSIILLGESGLPASGKIVKVWEE